MRGIFDADRRLRRELDELLDEVTKVMTARAKEDVARVEGKGP